MMYGDNVVYYTPVEAYPVMLMDGGIISGGTGGDETSTQGVRFTWVYDPDIPGNNPSGFTGGGWFAETEGSPIWYSIKNHGMTLDGILDGFENGSRDSLNDVFTYWQTYVDVMGSQGKDILQDFQYTVPRGCWSNLN